jgi:hypothetical protein
MLVGFFGPMHAGKSEAAKRLVATMGFERQRFAGPLKDMLVTAGLEVADVDGDRKETPNALLDGATPRHAMQTLGTEWGRKCISKTFWINLWARRARASLAAGAHVVVDDLRFPNEAAAIRALGGVVVFIDRPAPPATRLERFRRWFRGLSRHASERVRFDADVTIVNAGDLAQFHMLVDAFGRDLSWSSAARAAA